MATWKIDPAHSSADFTVRHMMVTNVRGSISNITGTINFDPENPAAASVEAQLDVNTISTNVSDRDNHLRSADFFNIETHPHITFKSTGVTVKDSNNASVVGDLTIGTVTNQVTLEVEYLGSAASPFGDQRAGFTAETKIDREAFGLTWNQVLESGGFLVGKEVKITLDLEAILVPEVATA